MYLSILTRQVSKFSSSFVQKMANNVSSSVQRAERVQANVLDQQYTIEQQAKLRSKVTIESSIQNLEKEMYQEIARSLKRSEDKVAFLLQKTESMYESLKKYSSPDRKQIEAYNALVQLCQKARWEFMVHRQACGFTIRNYQIVHEMFRIPPKLA